LWTYSTTLMEINWSTNNMKQDMFLHFFLISEFMFLLTCAQNLMLLHMTTHYSDKHIIFSLKSTDINNKQYWWYTLIYILLCQETFCLLKDDMNSVSCPVLELLLQTDSHLDSHQSGDYYQPTLLLLQTLIEKKLHYNKWKSGIRQKYETIP
jgi:hypothetical protein